MKREHLAASCIKIMPKRMILVAVLLLSILFPLGYEGMAAPVTLTIVHTNNVNGHLFACPS